MYASSKSFVEEALQLKHFSHLYVYVFEHGPDVVNGDLKTILKTKIRQETAMKIKKIKSMFKNKTKQNSAIIQILIN